MDFAELGNSDRISVVNISKSLVQQGPCPDRQGQFEAGFLQGFLRVEVIIVSTMQVLVTFAMESPAWLDESSISTLPFEL